MGLWDRVATFFALDPFQDRLETRSLESFSISAELGRAIRLDQPWRAPSVKEALAVPAILRAVTLISNTAGALTMDGMRNGQRVDPEARPRLIVRPNPLTTPRVFWRDTAYYKATRGESWWWVAKRDVDGRALSLVPVPPYEVTVEANAADMRYPIIRWRGRQMPNEDMIQDTLMPDPGDPLRGAGPLQLCGAAVSVAVESQQWAANFYAEGGFPSVYLKSDYDFPDEDEPAKIKAKWTATPPNTPHIISPGLEPGTLDMNTEGAQMLNARVHDHGEVALMFGIPGSLLEYTQSGSSLTYQNVGQRFDDFVKGCLWPNYLEGTEQCMSDLLPRSWVGRFDTDAFTRPDPKTRMEIHQIAIASGVYDSEEAGRQEGFAPGSIETAPVDAGRPEEMPPPIQLRSRPGPVRCDGLHRFRNKSGIVTVKTCGKLLAEAGPFVGTCPRCKRAYPVAA
jgi:HK97 family phage portal protein